MVKQVVKTLFLFSFVIISTQVFSQQSKARGQYLSLNRSNTMFKGNKDGFDFEKLTFKYQFVNCNGEVMLGVTYDKNASYTRYWKDGVAYERGDLKSKPWPSPKSIRLKDVEAELYFGSTKLGKVNIADIPEVYRGCGGRMYNVLKFLGINPKKSVYKSNINQLRLGEITVTKAGVIQP